jgi:hypothetical protein
MAGQEFQSERIVGFHKFSLINGEAYVERYGNPQEATVYNV